MASTAIFVTGAGTGVGKTLISAALVHQLRASGRPCRALKPVMSGWGGPQDVDCDAAVLLAAAGSPADATTDRVVDPAALDAISPWRFAAPLSPHLAAEAEGRSVSLSEVCAFCREAIEAAARDGGTVVIEGVGGVMAPLSRTHTVLDWIAELGVPTVLVTGSYLGAMSHALTAASALAQRGVAPLAVLVSESKDSVGLAKTAETLSAFFPEAAVVPIPRIPDTAAPWKSAPNILEVCLKN